MDINPQMLACVNTSYSNEHSDDQEKNTPHYYSNALWNHF